LAFNRPSGSTKEADGIFSATILESMPITQSRFSFHMARPLWISLAVVAVTAILCFGVKGCSLLIEHLFTDETRSLDRYDERLREARSALGIPLTRHFPAHVGGQEKAAFFASGPSFGGGRYLKLRMQMNEDDFKRFRDEYSDDKVEFFDCTYGGKLMDGFNLPPGVPATLYFEETEYRFPADVNIMIVERRAHATAGIAFSRSEKEVIYWLDEGGR